jgi:hypothetical protein
MLIKVFIRIIRVSFIKSLDFEVWALLWREKRNDISDGFNGLDKVDVTRCPTVGMINGENIFRSTLEGAHIHLYDPEKPNF